MKPETLVVSVTALKDSMCGVCSFRCSDVSGAASLGIRGLANFKPEAANLHSLVLQLLKVARPELPIPPGEFLVSQSSKPKLQTFTMSITALTSRANPNTKQQQQPQQQNTRRPELLLLAWVASFYSLIWPRPHPADWSILQSTDWSILQSADWCVFTEC
uniref:Uncharacterized protein n=1 Tax=Macaca fascicularis TaxID=9541 RepID=A0A7N9CQ99_MACFA